MLSFIVLSKSIRIFHCGVDKKFANDIQNIKERCRYKVDSFKKRKVGIEFSIRVIYIQVSVGTREIF